MLGCCWCKPMPWYSASSLCEEALAFPCGPPDSNRIRHLFASMSRSARKMRLNLSYRLGKGLVEVLRLEASLRKAQSCIITPVSATVWA
jgi:hypothetical protein